MCIMTRCADEGKEFGTWVFFLPILYVLIEIIESLGQHINDDSCIDYQMFETVVE